ncbi:MAG: hypothetical protein F6K03_12055, partial [Kamptonema sp. SIO4C4]|nr:hypothetical protein [Kamptonema sp. SIO4C4]
KNTETNTPEKNTPEKGDKTVTATQSKEQEPKKQEGGLQVYQKGYPLPQNRPVESSHLKVFRTYNSMGIRPVTTSNLNITHSIVLSGNRPVTKGSLMISEQYSVMGNRPVASNEIEDIATLIGYLD